MSTMLFHRDEVRELVCPVRSSGQQVDKCCLGPKCMAWMWQKMDENTPEGVRLGYCIMWD